MISDADRERMASNRQGWNQRAPASLRSTYFDVDSFKAGRNTLHTIEREALGDVRGRSLLELQCSIGVDALSLARDGARVTAVDYAAESIAIARGLAEELALDVRFVCSDVYELPHVLDERFDIVFTSSGVLGCLPDLAAWGRVVAHFLNEGGSVHVVEIHPIVHLFEQVDGQLKLARSLFKDGPYQWRIAAAYARQVSEQEAVAPHTQYTWPWRVADLVTVLIEAGLRIDRLQEVPVDIRQRFPMMVGDGDGWRLPGDPLPLAVVCSATKPSQ